jgi:hypothetical protein
MKKPVRPCYLLANSASQNKDSQRSLPEIGKVTVSKPIPQDTAGLVQPLTSFVRFLKTYSLVLRLARTVNVIILIKKNRIWQMPPIVSNTFTSFRNQRFNRTGNQMKPHIIIAVCQLFGSYDSLLKIIRAVVIFERLAGFEAAANIHAATVIQPEFTF